MKLNKLVVAMGLGMALISGAANAADAGHGTVTFTGAIIDAPCSIKADQEDQTVKMGQISDKMLESGGASTPEAFSIVLTDCNVVDADDAVSIKFFGTESDADADLFKLKGGTAAGASLAITNEDAEIIKNGEVTALQTLVNGENTLNFTAYLKGDGASTVTPGDFNTVANFELSYN